AFAAVRVGLVMAPALPAVILPAVPHRLPLSHAPAPTSDQGPSPDALDAQARATPDPDSRSSHLQTSGPAEGPPPLVLGYYVNWDAASIVSLRLHLGALTHLVPEWLTLQNAQGDVDDTADPGVIRLARAANLPILALVTNFRDGWRGDELHVLLNDPEA